MKKLNSMKSLDSSIVIIHLRSNKLFLKHRNVESESIDQDDVEEIEVFV